MDGVKSKKKIIIILILLILLGLFGISYALWQLTFKQETANTMTTGCFKLEFQDNNPINLKEALPITDEEGKKLIPYTVTVVNMCNTLVKYQVNLDILNTTTLNNPSYIKTQFQENDPIVLSSLEEVSPTVDNAKVSYRLETGVLSKLGSKTFHFRLWMNETTPNTSDAMNKVFASKVIINTIRETDYYVEDILNGADPVLKDDLIPVTIFNNGDVIKADIREKWYSYEDKMWANAVILKDKSIEYADGAIIPEANIESYFVWVPRYRYKIFNDEKYDGLTDIDNSKIQIIEVEFETKNVQASTGNKKDEWLTHPAFTTFNVDGMWVGKFETSKSNEALANSINAVGVQIKPNVISWRNIQVGNAFYTSYYYQRNLDSHLIKNSEWGAIAYLQHSKYGSSNSIRFNNNSDFITGYASVKEPTCGNTNDNRECNKRGTTSDITLAYNTEIGYLASTTGNITGIYDIAGGGSEYVMAVMTNQNGIPVAGANASSTSGFIGPYGEGGSATVGYSWPSEKYYDKYLYAVGQANFALGYLGDATNEMGPFKSIVYANNLERRISSWYTDNAHFIDKSWPWFHRGSWFKFGCETGMFSFGASGGGALNDIGFRIVLAF